MKAIKESEVSILERLHDYRFLTCRQMSAMGFASEYTIYQGVNSLHSGGKKYIDWVDFGVTPELGRTERLIYLTKHGAELLAEVLQLPVSAISYPKSTRPPSRKDLVHRNQTVDLHIMARTYCETHNAELDYFKTYFEYSGGNNTKDPSKPNRRAVNTITIEKGNEFIPDCIFKITTKKGKQYLYTAEIYRNHDTKRTWNQLYKHLQGLEKKTISTLYNFPHSVQVLVLCEKREAMQALQEKLADDPAFKLAEDNFLFRLLDTIEPPKPEKKGKKGSKKAPTDTAKKQTRTKIKTLLDGGFTKGWETYTGKKKVLFR